MKVYYMRQGTVTHGQYVGGDWEEDELRIEVKAKSLEKLHRKVDKATAKHSSKGSYIDFGFRSNVKNVMWDSKILKIEELEA